MTRPLNDPDLRRILKWCSDNEVVFKVTNEDGVLAITGSCDNISSTHPIVPNVAPPAVGFAVWSALYGVKSGTEFHARSGYFPNGENTASAGGLAPPAAAGSDHGGPAPDATTPGVLRSDDNT